MKKFGTIPYAPLTNQLVSTTPLQFDNSVYFNFIMKANMSKLQKVCNEWFNVPSGFNKVYEPVMPFVMVTFNYNPRAYALDWKKDNQGFLPYNELIFVMFVKEKKKYPILETLGMDHMNFYGFVPYLFLDNAIPVASGREVFGMPKVMADLDYPKIGDTGPGQKFSAHTLGFDNSKTRVPIAEKQLIMEVECPKDFDIEAILEEANGNPQDALAREFYRRTDTETVNLDLANMMMKVHSMPYLNMRQHRNVLKPHTAIKKSIIDFPGRNITVTNGGLLPGPFEIKFGKNSKTYPVFESLGLDPEPFMSFWFQWSFMLDNGVNAWEWKGY